LIRNEIIRERNFVKNWIGIRVIHYMMGFSDKEYKELRNKKEKEFKINLISSSVSYLWKKGIKKKGEDMEIRKARTF